MPELAAGIVRLSSHLEFVGKGVDEKTFLMEIKKISTMQPALCISTFVSDYPDAMRYVVLGARKATRILTQP